MRWPAHLPATARSMATREPVIEIGCVEPAVGAQLGAQVDLVEREQARAELTLGGDAHAVTALAERLGDARDHTDVADAVEITPAGGGLHVRDRSTTPTGTPRDALDDLVRGNHLRFTPRALRVERHELDEAHSDPAFASEAREVDDLVVVHAAHHDRVDLHRARDRRRSRRRSPRRRARARPAGSSARKRSRRSVSSDTLTRFRPAWPRS